MDNRISTTSRFVVHHVREGAMALAEGARVLAFKINPIREGDNTFLKVLVWTVVAIAGVIAVKRLMEHVNPLEKPSVPLVPAKLPVPPVNSPQGLHLHNGVWGWHGAS